MIVVANSFMLNIFKRIPIFELNLGTSLIPLKGERVKLKDPFMLKYFNMTGKQVLTYGKIGKLIFYQDFTLPNRDFLIFNDDTIYSLYYSNEDSELSAESYLASIVKEINDKEGIKNSKDSVNIVKNDPDIKLPTDQYIQEMIKKRKKQDV